MRAAVIASHLAGSVVKHRERGEGGKEIHGNLCLALTVNLLIDTFSKHFLGK